MVEPAPDRRRAEVPLAAYVIASALLWATFLPILDWLVGDLVSVGGSMLKGAVVGLAWGLAMYPFERWLRARGRKRDRTPPAP